MTQIQVQFPESLNQRLKDIAVRQNLTISQVVRKATEQFVARFPEEPKPKAAWRFPTLDCGGDFLNDPASMRSEADVILQRSGS